MKNCQSNCYDSGCIRQADREKVRDKLDRMRDSEINRCRNITFFFA